MIFFYIRKKFMGIAHYNSLTQCLPPRLFILDVLWSLMFYGLFTSFKMETVALNILCL